ncbi:MAG: glycosyltransferase [Bauldia sp.]
MTVLQVMPAYYPATTYGGPIFSVHYACQALAQIGVGIRVATTNANGRSKLDVPTNRAVAFEPNYVVRYYDDSAAGRFSLPFALGLWRDVKAAGVVHLQDIYSAHAIETLVLARLLARPLLVSPRGSFSDWALTKRKPRLKQMTLSLISSLTDRGRRVAWHATSPEERAEVLSLFPGATVHVVPNGIDCAPFDRAEALSRDRYLARFFPAAAVAADEAQILIAMGRLHRKKCFEVVIEALRLVSERFPDAVLLIAGGDDGERARLEAMTAASGLRGRAALVGELSGEDKIAFLKGADLFLFPSHSENFGMSCLEALAAGLPVVASRNTPWSAVEVAGCGLWVENSAPAFAAAIDRLLGSNLSAMRDNARAHAGGYDIAMIAGALRQIYQDLIDGHAG